MERRMALRSNPVKEATVLSSGNNRSSSTTLIAVLATLVVAGVGGFMIGQRTGETHATLEGQVVATVNGTKITKQDLYDRLVPLYGSSAVSEMIDEALVNQAAQEANVKVTQADVDARLAEIKERMGGEEQFRNILAMYGISEEAYRRSQEMWLKAAAILGPQITVTDEEIEQFFNENIAVYDQRKVHARHILVDDEETAREIKAELDAGADFATLAKERSKEPAAATTGGDLGTFGRGDMVAEFSNVVFNLPVNEISEPFQSKYGWHVAQVLEITGEAPDFQALKETIRQDLVEEKVGDQLSEWLQGLRDKAKIKNTLESSKAAG